MASSGTDELVKLVLNGHHQYLADCVRKQRIVNLNEVSKEHGTTPLVMAVARLKYKCVRKLLSLGADVNARDGEEVGVGDSVTPLLELCFLDERTDVVVDQSKKNVLRIAHALIKAGADVNAVYPKDGHTCYQKARFPLTRLVDERAALCDLLLRHGAAKKEPSFGVKVWLDIDWLSYTHVKVTLNDTYRDFEKRLAAADNVDLANLESAEVYVVNHADKQVVESLKSSNESPFMLICRLFEIDHTMVAYPVDRKTLELQLLTKDEYVLPVLPFPGNSAAGSRGASSAEASGSGGASRQTPRTRSASRSESETYSYSSYSGSSRSRSGSESDAGSGDRGGSTSDSGDDESSSEGFDDEQSDDDEDDIDIERLNSSFGAFLRWLRAVDASTSPEELERANMASTIEKLKADGLLDGRMFSIPRSSSKSGKSDSTPLIRVTPLCEAAKSGNVHLVRALLDAGANPGELASSRFCVREGVLTDDTLSLLLVSGKYQEKAREKAIRRVQRVWERPFRKLLRWHSPVNAVHVAAACGHKEVCEVLIDAAFDLVNVGTPGTAEPFAMSMAIANGHNEVAKLLWRTDKDVLNEARRNLSCPVAAAALFGGRELLQWLLDRGAHESCYSDNATTWAAYHGQRDTLELLVEYIDSDSIFVGVVFAATVFGGPVLDSALVLMNYYSTSPYITEKKYGNGNLTEEHYDVKGPGLLHFLAYLPTLDVAAKRVLLDMLVQRGDDINRVHYKDTALSNCATRSHAACVQLLLAYNAAEQPTALPRGAYERALVGSGTDSERFHCLRLLSQHRVGSSRWRRFLIVLRFVQLVVDFLFLFALPFSATIAWPLSFAWLFELANLLLFHWLPLIGVSPIVITASVVGLVAVLIVFVLMSMFRRCHDTEFVQSRGSTELALFDTDEQFRRWGVKLLDILSLLLAQLLFIPIFTGLIRAFDCTRQMDGTLRWDQNFEVECYKGEHLVIFIFGALVLVPYLYWAARVVRTDGRFSGITYRRSSAKKRRRLSFWQRIIGFKHDKRTLDASEWHFLMRSPWLGSFVNYVELSVKIVSSAVVVLLGTWPFLLSVVFLLATLIYVAMWVWKPHTRLSALFSGVDGVLRIILLANAAMAFIVAALHNGLAPKQELVDGDLVHIDGTVTLELYGTVLGGAMLLGIVLVLIWLRVRENPRLVSAKELRLTDERGNERKVRALPWANSPIGDDGVPDGCAPVNVLVTTLLAMKPGSVDEDRRADLAKLIEKSRYVLNSRSRGDGWVPLEVLTMVGDLQLVQMALGHGALPNIRSANGALPLNSAAIDGRADICEALIGAGANANMIVRTSPVHQAARNGHADVLRLLIDAGADLNRYYEKTRDTVLHIAALNGHTKCVEMLLAAGADAEALDAEGITPLFEAIRDNHLECVRLLLAHNVNVEHRTLFGWSAVAFAASMGTVCITQELLDAGASTERSEDDSDGMKVYLEVFEKMKANKWTYSEAVVHCREQFNVAVTWTGDDSRVGGEVMSSCLCSGFVDDVRALLDAGADVNGVDYMLNLTYLAIALQADCEDPVPVVRLLLERGANASTIVVIKDEILSHGYICARRGHVELMELLLKHGVDPTQTANLSARRTVLFGAIESKNVDVVRAVLEAGADACQRDEDNFTALHYAASKSFSAEIINLLIEKGAKQLVNALDGRGYSPLFYACLQNSPKCAEALFLQGADPNLTTEKLETPLATARRFKQRKLTRLLLKHGATKLAKLSPEAKQVAKALRAAAGASSNVKAVKGTVGIGTVDEERATFLKMLYAYFVALPLKAASTQEIMNHFRSRVGREQSTSFSMALSALARFDKNEKLWVLKANAEEMLREAKVEAGEGTALRPLLADGEELPVQEAELEADTKAPLTYFAATDSTWRTERQMLQLLQPLGTFCSNVRDYVLSEGPGPVGQSQLMAVTKHWVGTEEESGAFSAFRGVVERNRGWFSLRYNAPNSHLLLDAEHTAQMREWVESCGGAVTSLAACQHFVEVSDFNFHGTLQLLCKFSVKQCKWILKDQFPDDDLEGIYAEESSYSYSYSYSGSGDEADAPAKSDTSEESDYLQSSELWSSSEESGKSGSKSSSSSSSEGSSDSVEALGGGTWRVDSLARLAQMHEDVQKLREGLASRMHESRRLALMRAGEHLYSSGDRRSKRASATVSALDSHVAPQTEERIGDHLYSSKGTENKRLSGTSSALDRRRGQQLRVDEQLYSSGDRRAKLLDSVRTKQLRKGAGEKLYFSGDRDTIATVTLANSGEHLHSSGAAERIATVTLVDSGLYSSGERASKRFSTSLMSSWMRAAREAEERKEEREEDKEEEEEEEEEHDEKDIELGMRRKK